MIERSPVLLTWVAVNNDPYEHDATTGKVRLVRGKPVPGPTLTVLQDADSPYSGKIKDVVLLHQSGLKGIDSRESRSVRDLEAVLTHASIRVHHYTWDGTDPTDHAGLFAFLRNVVPKIRTRFSGRELLIHVSPGTPAMHTLWVLMAETGFVDVPFKLVKSYRARERHGRGAVAAVSLDLETFYKAYKLARPRQGGAEDQHVHWDPAKFRSNRMKQVYAQARRYARLNVPVLILGERGTGKTTLASWIRVNSPFRRSEQDSSWPCVACGQYNAETMRAELFGYKKGSFTGATTDHDGVLAAAHKDTLFLDEIGDISPNLQRLLIKAVEEKQYFALGDDKPRTSDFRLLTATNISDSELKKRLDPDFLDRISPLSLTLPALRDIPDELPWLWEAVYAQAASRAGVGKPLSRLPAAQNDAVVGRLRRHPLPGNVRDLFRVAYRILAARADVDNPLSPSEAVAFSLDGVAEQSPIGASGSAMSRRIAAAFGSHAPIDDILTAGTRISTGVILSEFRRYLAGEIRRVAKARRVPTEEICELSSKTLRNWLL